LVPKPNTPCRLQTVDRLQTVNLLVNPNGSVRSKRGLTQQDHDKTVYPT
jgi:hypothetical protein